MQRFLYYLLSDNESVNGRRCDTSGVPSSLSGWVDAGYIGLESFFVADDPEDGGAPCLYGGQYGIIGGKSFDFFVEFSQCFSESLCDEIR